MNKTVKRDADDKIKIRDSFHLKLKIEAKTFLNYIFSVVSRNILLEDLDKTTIVKRRN